MRCQVSRTLMFSLLLLIGAEISASRNATGLLQVEEEKIHRNSLFGRPWLLRHEKKNEDGEFPDDLFTLEQLRHGAAVLHFFGAAYSFVMIGIVCSNYFLPSVDCICIGLNMSQDVAAATFMSFATTAPELFTVIIGTFITESDVGLGAIIGCGMFNILGVATFAGLAAKKSIQLDWWPLFRDSIMYLVALTALVFVIHDREINFENTFILIGCYAVYFMVMVCNQHCRRLVKIAVKTVKGTLKKKKSSIKEKPFDGAKAANSTASIVKPTISVVEVKETVEREKFEPDIGSFEDDTSYKAYFINYDKRSLSRRSIKSDKGSITGKHLKENGIDNTRRDSNFLPVQPESLSPAVSPKDSHDQVIIPSYLDPRRSSASLKNPQELHEIHAEEAEEMVEEEFKGIDLLHKPEGTFWKSLLWLIFWPAKAILFITIPDCRVLKWRRFYPLTFLMCIIWIGVINYFGNWMTSVIGYTIGIPDSVMGLTFLAAGGSMPEAVSMVIMARQGEGGLGFSNSLGGSTMDICICLGIPWLIKTSMSGPINLDSNTLQYNSLALYFGILVLQFACVHTKFKVNKKMGLICLLSYSIFIVVAVLLELNVIEPYT